MSVFSLCVLGNDVGAIRIITCVGSGSVARWNTRMEIGLVAEAPVMHTCTQRQAQRLKERCAVVYTKIDTQAEKLTHTHDHIPRQMQQAQIRTRTDFLDEQGQIPSELGTKLHIMGQTSKIQKPPNK